MSFCTLCNNHGVDHENGCPKCGKVGPIYNPHMFQAFDSEVRKEKSLSFITAKDLFTGITLKDVLIGAAFTALGVLAWFVGSIIRHGL